MGRAGDRASSRKLGIDALFKTSIEVFRATEGSTVHTPQLAFGVETTVRTVAAKKESKLFGGVLEAAERFMVKRQNYKAELSR